MQIKITIEHHFSDINPTEIKAHGMPRVVASQGRWVSHALLTSPILCAVFLKCNFIKCFKLGTTFDRGIPPLRSLPKGNAKAIATNYVPCRSPR